MQIVDRLKIGNTIYELGGYQIGNLQTSISDLQDDIDSLTNRITSLESNLITGSIQLTFYQIQDNYCEINVHTTNVSNRNNIKYYTTFGNMMINSYDEDITNFVTYISGNNNDFRIKVSTDILSPDDIYDIDGIESEYIQYNIHAEVTDDFGKSISSDILFINTYESSYIGYIGYIG